MNLYFARHAQSVGNVFPGKGGTDPDLTELGMEQARQLGIRLSALRFDCIISSPLSRALATANEVAVRQEGGAAAVELLPDLMECGIPASFVPRPFDQLLEICPIAVRYTLPTAAGGGESLPEEFDDGALYLARAYRNIGYLRRRFQGEENVLVVSHGVFLSRLVACALRFSYPDHFNFSHDNTGLTLVRYLTDNGHLHTKLGFLNDTSHLYRAGLIKGV